MEPYGVLCRRADGEQIVITTDAESPAHAREQVDAHRRLFYGPGDTAGRWLASKNPDTLVEVGPAKPLAVWGAPKPARGPSTARPPAR